MRSKAVLSVALTVVLGVAVTGLDSASAARTSTRGFSARVDNPWFPLKPGTQYAYTGIKDGKPSRELMVVTRQFRMIQTAPCVVVQDRLWVRGRLHERTIDYYTQDAQGNVWYYGEQTAELAPSGRVTSTDGTWMTGVNGAQPGVYMPAHPHVGQSGRMEYYKGYAEDHFRVAAVLGTVTSGTPNSVLTEETTPLQPGVLDNKLYVYGIGTVTELTVKGGSERNQLVSVTRT